jgi:site-specific recombinase XerD
VSDGERQQPRLLDRVRHALAQRHHSPKTVKAYVSWIRRFILFHGRRHPSELGEQEVSAFLTDLAVRQQVSASTQNQALAAVLFLYSQVLGVELEQPSDIVHARRPSTLPVVMTRSEVAAVLAQLRGVERLMASLLYGSLLGLPLTRCSQLALYAKRAGAQR